MLTFSGRKNSSFQIKTSYLDFGRAPIICPCLEPCFLRAVPRPFKPPLEPRLRLNTFKLNTLAAAAILVTLTACGGGGGGSDAGSGAGGPGGSSWLAPAPLTGLVANKVLPATTSVVLAGQPLQISAEATAVLASVTSQAWTVTQVSGTTTTTSAPTIADAGCAGAVVSPGNVASSKALGHNGSSLCSTVVVVPADAPTSEWVISNVSKSASGSAGGKFTLSVIRQAPLDSGFGLVISGLPKVLTVGQTSSLTAGYATGAGAVLDGVVSYTWSQISGTTVPLAGSASSTVSFIPHVAGDYVFGVTATAVFNGKKETRTGTLVAAVGAAPAVANTFTVSAGAITSSTVNKVSQLTGVVDGTALPSELAYKWTAISGPSTTLFSDDTLTPEFLPTVTGSYVFELRVTQAGSTPVVKTSRVLVSVIPAAASSEPFFGISAGDPQMIAAAPVLATLKASISLNNLINSQVAYQWTQVSGPALTLTNSTSLVAGFNAVLPGLYVFDFAATSGTTVKHATTSVLVPALTFTVSAGTIASTLVNTSTTLAGGVSGSVPAEKLSYRWAKVSGPAVTLYAADTLAPQFMAATSGDYEFELSVTQSGVSPSVVKTSRVLVVVTENSGTSFFGGSAGDAQVAGPAPVAVLLTSSVIASPGNTEILYRWTQLATDLIQLPVISNAESAQASFVGADVGTYNFKLEVTVGGVTKASFTTVHVVDKLPT